MQRELQRTAALIRRQVIEQSWRAGLGHIGSCLSIVDILAALYGTTLRIDHPGDPHRDRFILSKGHAALALYAALYATGRLSEEELTSYCADGSALAGHPEHVVDYVELSTGSLGHGLGVAAGLALAARLQGHDWRTFALLSDAECNAGSVWEAAMFAAHHRLGGLVAIVDANGQQALGPTAEILQLEPLIERWRAVGWEAIEVDGHDPDRLSATLVGLDRSRGPHVVIARTVFGRGISFMEGELAWHYSPLDGEQYRCALDELEPSAVPNEDPR